MAWVRVDDQFPDHPKVVSAGPLAAWLFVAGLCYCNRFLTNGFIPLNQVERLVPFDGRRDESESPFRLKDRLVAVGLWTETEKKGIEGILIHDYLKYQSSRTQALKARDVTAARQGRFRSAKRNGQRNGVTTTVTNGVTNGPVTPAPIPIPIPSTEKEDVPPPAVTARSKRPVFKGQRLVVFEWQLDDCMQVLGTHTEDFDLHEWFFTIDRSLVASNLVLPKRDGGRWMQTELLKEVKKRRLPIAGELLDDDLGPYAWVCRTCNAVHEGTAEQARQFVCLKHAEESA